MYPNDFRDLGKMNSESRTIVLDFRWISTHGLYTSLHNLIIVDIPHRLVVLHSLT